MGSPALRSEDQEADLGLVGANLRTFAVAKGDYSLHHSF